MVKLVRRLSQDSMENDIVWIVILLIQISWKT